MPNDTTQTPPLTDEAAPAIPPQAPVEEQVLEDTVGTVEPDIEQIKTDRPEPEAEQATKTPDKKEISSPAIEESDPRFSMPRGYQDRFLLVKERDRQDLYRSSDDKTPTITDLGNQLSTRKADRATAIDMVELAAHRGWDSMKVRGPEEFRREMWIEGNALGLSIQGYRPREVDIAEAQKRAEIVGVRSIENTSKDAAKSKDTASMGKTSTEATLGADDKTPIVVERPNYEQGVPGKIIDIGVAPYQNKDKAADSPFVTLELADGREHSLWGVRLPDMIKAHDLKVGDKANIQWDGYKDVTLTVTDRKTGELKEITSQRREWKATDIERVKDKEAHKPKEVIKPVKDTAPVSKEHQASKNSPPSPDYEQGVSGKITDMGTAPLHEKSKTNTPFITLELADGREHKISGLRLPEMAFAHDLKVGDTANIKWNGYKNVILTTKDKITGEAKEVIRHQRDWTATDIQRAKIQDNNITKAVTPQEQEKSVNDTETSKNIHFKDLDPQAEDKQQNELERIAARIRSPEAVNDPKLIGAKSIIARTDIELRALGLPEEKRERTRQELALELAKEVQKGKVFDIQKLPNVTKEQEKSAKNQALQKHKDMQTAKLQERTKDDDKDKGQER